VDAVTAVIKEVCSLKVQPDGLVFDLASVSGEAIKEDADYSGVRVTFLVTLQNARISMQIDTGFGDVVTPSVNATTYPVLLDFPAPELLSYPRETVVAEKFEAMTKLGTFNSRMKDFYDIWILSRQFSFDGASLADAISQTFANRQTAVTAKPVALTLAFSRDNAKQTQWRQKVPSSSGLAANWSHQRGSHRGGNSHSKTGQAKKGDSSLFFICF